MMAHNDGPVLTIKYIIWKLTANLNCLQWVDRKTLEKITVSYIYYMKGLRYKTCNYFHKGVANGCICLHNLITGQVFWKCILKQFCFELIYDKLGTKRCVCSVSTNALRHYVNNGLSYWDFCELRIVIVSNYIISIFHCSVKNFTSAWPPFFF